MICKLCDKKEHTCTNCQLTAEQEFYLRGLRVCSECYSKHPELSEKYSNYDETTVVSRDPRYDGEFLAECSALLTAPKVSKDG